MVRGGSKRNLVSSQQVFPAVKVELLVQTEKQFRLLNGVVDNDMYMLDPKEQS
jgi:hypothetical protein